MAPKRLAAHNVVLFPRFSSDHPGVSNAVLVAEKDPMAAKYNEKSVAEQNSISISWNILMQPEYQELRDCIFATQDEFLRFRQVRFLHFLLGRNL